MNCRHLAGILPELISGELEISTAQLAEEHIRSCPSCAAERAAYADALCALAQPRAMLEAPAELDRLEIPQPSRGFAWLRPALATAALAAVMAGVMLMPRPHNPIVSQSPVKSQPARHETTVAATPDSVVGASSASVHSPSLSHPAASRVRRYPAREVLVAMAPSPRPLSVARALASESGSADGEYADRLSSPAKPMVMETAIAPPAPLMKSEPSVRSSAATARRPIAVDGSQGSIMVVACDLDETPAPAELHIKSTNPATGRTTVYDRSSDADGNDRVIEITSNAPML